MKSVLRWIAGALLGPIVALCAVLLLPTERSGQPTIAGMANIAYLVVLVRHVVVFGLLYGLLFPLLFPKSSTRPLASLAVGGVIGSCLLSLVFFELDMSRHGGADYFAAVTWRDSILATVISLLTCFLVGLRKNQVLMTASYWNRIFRRLAARPS